MPFSPVSHSKAAGRRRFKTAAMTLLVGLGCALVIARGDDATDQAAARQPASCRTMLETIKSRVAKMPAGVEKLAAQKEIGSAEIALKQGAESECRTHLRNASEAMRAHGTN